ncbi:MAG TPA: TylF/MycF/NovP-related O-methyltransferase [Caulobacteraceae bacterium]|nr:TylF/MycF/NovP-related O-methyltransferase [Caulobacteraceae bacterium]
MPIAAAATTAELRERYLDLVERALLNDIHGEPRLERALRIAATRLRHPWQTRAWAPRDFWPVQAHTMIGRPRLTHLRGLVEATLAGGIDGDYIETGVWRGGACILIRAVLAAHGVRDRRVFVADSFEGLPPPDAARFPADRNDRLSKFADLAVSEAQVQRNFEAYDLLDEQVIFLKGFFKDTLPALKGHPFALIRLDGDMYESTHDALTSLYDGVSAGGYVVVDDYGIMGACRQAVHDFLDARGLAPHIEPIDASGVWWRKE